LFKAIISLSAMFAFIKKLKTVYEIPEPLSVRERALKVFSRIEGR
jgi:hypothetical protein